MKTIVLLFSVMILPAFSFASPEDEFLQKGNVYLVSGNYMRAINMFNKATEINSQSATAYSRLGTAYLKMGDNEAASNIELIEKARDAFDQALRLNSDLTDARYNRSITNLLLFNKQASVEDLIYLQGKDKNLADALLVKIKDYKEPKNYKYVRGSGSVTESSSSDYPATPVYSSPPTVGSSPSESESDRLARCQNEADRNVSYPSGTTSMKASIRSEAETDYQNRKMQYISSCTGRSVPTPTTKIVVPRPVVVVPPPIVNVHPW